MAFGGGLASAPIICRRYPGAVTEQPVSICSAIAPFRDYPSGCLAMTLCTWLVPVYLGDLGVAHPALRILTM